MKLKVTFAVLLLASGVATADPFDALQIDSKNCTLVHSGTDNKNAVYTGRAEIGMCFITVPTTEFSQTYSFCALSGVLALSDKANGRVGCQFGYFDAKHEQVSFIGSQKNVCEFICMRK